MPLTITSQEKWGYWNKISVIFSKNIKSCIKFQLFGKSMIQCPCKFLFLHLKKFLFHDLEIS